MDDDGGKIGNNVNTSSSTSAVHVKMRQLTNDVKCLLHKEQ